MAHKTVYTITTISQFQRLAGRHNYNGQLDQHISYKQAYLAIVYSKWYIMFGSVSMSNPLKSKRTQLICSWMIYKTPLDILWSDFSDVTFSQSTHPYMLWIYQTYSHNCQISSWPWEVRQESKVRKRLNVNKYHPYIVSIMIGCVPNYVLNDELNRSSIDSAKYALWYFMMILCHIVIGM